MGPVQVSPVESVTHLAHRKKRGRGSESVPLMFLLLTRVRSHLDECVLADQTGSSVRNAWITVLSIQSGP
jgi:hypothetical protein